MNWIKTVHNLLNWAWLRSGSSITMNLVVQLLLAAGIVIGFSFIVPEVTYETAVFFTGGAVVLGLVTVGMVVGPQVLSNSKRDGIYQFNLALPVPRSALLVSDTIVSLITALPGVFAALLVSWLRFDIDLEPNWSALLVSVLLIALCTVSLGYAIGTAMSPDLAALMSQLVVFFALMFSPIAFPSERLPEWLAAVHEILPFESMADMVRQALDPPAGGVESAPYWLVVGWGIFGFAIAYWSMSRRP